MWNRNRYLHVKDQRACSYHLPTSFLEGQQWIPHFQLYKAEKGPWNPHFERKVNPPPCASYKKPENAIVVAKQTHFFSFALLHIKCFLLSPISCKGWLPLAMEIDGIHEKSFCSWKPHNIIFFSPELPSLKFSSVTSFSIFPIVSFFTNSFTI